MHPPLLFLLLLLPLSIAHAAPPFPVANRNQSKEEENVWDVIVKTCNSTGAGTDAAVYLKVYYEQGRDYETFQLDNPSKNDFERGRRDHFKLQFKQRDIVNVGMFWWPGFSLSQSWCVDWVVLLNSDNEVCFEAMFGKWVLHYRDPPTYATSFHELSYVDCVGPARSSAIRKKYTLMNAENKVQG